MLCYATLYYTILYYTILYYTILYYTILYYTILYYTILYYTILYYTILYNPRMKVMAHPKHEFDGWLVGGAGKALGRGDGTVGNPHRARISQF